MRYKASLMSCRFHKHSGLDRKNIRRLLVPVFVHEMKLSQIITPAFPNEYDTKLSDKSSSNN